MPAPTTTEYRLAELMAALSLATDIGTGEPMEKALRACLLAVRLGETLGLSDADLSDLYYLTLLRFIGCTASNHLLAAIFGDTNAFRAQTPLVDYTSQAESLRAIIQFVGAGLPPLQRASALAAAIATMAGNNHELMTSHCEVGQMLAGRLGLNETVQTALGQVTERWDGHGLPTGLKGEATLLVMRVANLAHGAAVFHRVGGVEGAVNMARKWSGGAFDPALVERFCRDAPRLCQALEVDSIWAAVLEAEPGPRLRLSEEQLETASRAVADFVDLKTTYTVNHSSGVARLAAAAARHCDLPESDVVSVRQAAYLHDLGQVGVSTLLWNKPGALTDGEWESVRLHPYYTERILSRAKPLAQLGAIGAAHHERLDGSGYPRRLPASMLSPLARILAAADAYHAMTEPRPHRPALSPDAAAETLRAEVRAGRLDGEAANAVLAAGHRATPARRAWVAGLTDREVEVLRLVARGLSNREIAQRLSISPHTAGHHIRHIYDKIDVSTRAAATLFTMHHNLLHDPADSASS
ncbi:MAG: HD domain-containing protein [Chloroflexi bacterium]|nr:HD domain-containing protein [Chloroflexota bacterium]